MVREREAEQQQERERNWEMDRKREIRKRVRNVNEFWIQASVQGKMSVPSRYLCFSRIANTRENPTLSYQILYLFLA